jgi:hypothetical protein
VNMLEVICQKIHKGNSKKVKSASVNHGRTSQIVFLGSYVH